MQWPVAVTAIAWLAPAFTQNTNGPSAGAADITVYAAPYPAFGEIERLDPALDALIPRDAEIRMLADGFDWAEGPVWVPDGDYLLFSAVRANSIYRWSETDGITLFMRPSGYYGERTDIPEPGSNGLALDIEGSLLLAEHGNRRIARLVSLREPNGDQISVADHYDGKRFNSPNDLAVASNGNIYFTDPPYGLAGQIDDPEKELDFQGVYLIRRSDKNVELLAMQTRPNGIGLSPDERTLYVANSDTRAPFIYAYAIEIDGTLGDRRVFLDARELVERGLSGVPDGMTVDRNGNLWATGPGGILVLDPTGRHLGTIVTGRATANCTLGRDGSTLFITADTALAKLDLE